MIWSKTTILRECGWDGYAVYCLTVDNEADGTPNTYRMLAAQSNKSERTIIRITQDLERAGHVSIERGNGRGNTTVIVPVKRDTSDGDSPKRVTERVTQTLTERVTERVTKPPTPPVGVNSTQIQEKLTTKTPISPRRKVTPFLDGFDEFYAAYPKHRDRDEAERAWSKLRPEPELRAVIMAAVAAQSQTDDWRKEGGRYVPYPATWINGSRWKDEVQPNAPTTGTKPSPPTTYVPGGNAADVRAELSKRGSLRGRNLST